MEKKENSIRDYLKKELENCIKLLNEDNELLQNLNLKKERYEEIHYYINNIKLYKPSIKVLLKYACGTIALICILLIRVNYGASLIEGCLYLVGIFGTTFLGSVNIPNVLNYLKNNKKLKQNNIGRELLEEIEPGYSKFQEKKYKEVNFPLSQCQERVCKYENAIYALWDILQSDDFVGDLDEYQDYYFVSEALMKEWESYLEEISDIKTEEYHYPSSIAPQIEFDKEKKLKKACVISIYE